MHSDIGGGYLEEKSGLAKVTLQWMIAEAKAAGLNVAQEAVDDVLGRSAQRQYAPVNPYAMIHDSMCGAWKILEYVPRRHWKPGLPPPGYEWILYRKRPRSVPENSVLHQAVLDRKNETKTGYNPTYRRSTEWNRGERSLSQPKPEKDPAPAGPFKDAVHDVCRRNSRASSALFQMLSGRRNLAAAVPAGYAAGDARAESLRIRADIKATK
jgi:hypothetical protein